MRHIKHDLVANYKTYSEDSRKELLIDEISKAILLYPKAIADVLTNCGIYYCSTSPAHLKRAIEQNNDDLRMLNKIVRLAFLVNRNGSTNYDKHNRNITYRNVMRTGKTFLNENRDILKSAVLETKFAMEELGFSEKLRTSVKTYLNMDGEEYGIDDDSEDYSKTEKEVDKRANLTPNRGTDAKTLIVSFLFFYGLIFAIAKQDLKK